MSLDGTFVIQTRLESSFFILNLLFLFISNAFLVIQGILIIIQWQHN